MDTGMKRYDVFLISAAVTACGASPTDAPGAGSPSETLGAVPAIDDVVSAAPLDAELARASAIELVDLSVRCLAIDGMTYCLHWGWDQGGRSSVEQLMERMQTDTTASDAESGDMPLEHALQRWAALPKVDRDAAERAELEEAQAVVGKVVYFDAIGSGKPLPADFAERYPGLASWAERLAVPVDSPPSPPLGFQQVPPGYDPPVYTMRSDRVRKQEKSYYCGPASMQAFRWNDPKSPLLRSQTYWAGYLHTEENGSTWIYDLKDQINRSTHWDDPDYASTYIVVNIGSWTNSTWANTLRHHIVNMRAPVQLHPKLSPSVSSYYPGTTSGHYNVGEGWFGGPSNSVSIYEPAGGPAQGNRYPYLFAAETIDNVRRANLNNANQRNISY
jgi:hypothetical protein